MKTTLAQIALLFAAAVLTAVEMTVEQDIPYIVRPGATPDETSLDLYAPTTPGPHPVMVWVHGGGWRNGDKVSGLADHKIDFFVSHGYVLASINYRLLPDTGPVPGGLTWADEAADVAAAVAWVRGHIATRGGDPRRIHIGGHSAGAHLAALVAADARYLRAWGFDPSGLAGQLLLDTAVYDLPSMAAAQGGALDGLYAAIFGQDPATWAAASPITYVRAGAAMPPAICMYSGGDDLAHLDVWRASIARNYAARLAREGVFARVTGDTTLTHEGINRAFGSTGDAVTADALGFLRALTPWARLDWRRDLVNGALDPEERSLGGTEVMSVVAHGTRLFAGNSYWNDGSGASPIAAVWRKDAADAPWREDLRFPGNALRVSCIRSVSFTTDYMGRPLDPPVRLLLASPQYAGGSTASVWSRNEVSGAWTRMVLATGITDASHATARAILDHVDAITGVHRVFAAIETSALYSGGYDPAAPGGIRWSTTPELTGSERMHSGCEADGVLWISVGTNGDPGDRDGGLFRRQDGPDSAFSAANPRWQLVWEWPKMVNTQPGLRGLTAVPDPLGGAHHVLIGGLESQDCIVRIDPGRGNAVTTEFGIRTTFTEAWGSIAGGAAIAGYNDMEPVVDPLTGEEQTLIGLWVNHPLTAQGSPYNGSWMLVRHRDGGYAWGPVMDWATAPAAPGLRATRDIASSPFAAGGGEAWACGFDGANGPHLGTGWILRGALDARPWIEAPTAVQATVGQPTAALAIAVADGWTAADDLVVTATSSDPVVVPAAGLVLAGAGAARSLRITPAAAGACTITVTVRDAADGVASRSFTCTAATAAPPQITSALTAAGAVGVPFLYEIIASASPTAYSATGLPPGLTLDGATGRIVGTPTTDGITVVTIGASNSVGVGSATLILTITAPTAGDGGTADGGSTGGGGGCGTGGGSGFAVLALLLAAATLHAQRAGPPGGRMPRRSTR